MNVAIIGCGLIGHKRAKTLGSAKMVACCDQISEKAEALAKQFPGCIALNNWQDVMCRDDIDIIIVATIHVSLAEIGLAALSAGKHVFIEKPAGRLSEEIEPLIVAAKKNNVLARVGFNHRYHRVFRKAKE